MKSICLRGEIHLLARLLTSSSHVNYEIFRVSLLKSVLPCLTNQAPRFISRGIDRSYFSGNFLLSFLLWYDFKILVKSRGGGTFLSLASSVNVWQKQFFFQLKAEYLAFHFLDLSETILNLMQVKINKNRQNFHRFLKFSLFYPLYDFRILVQIYQSIIQFDWARLTKKVAAKVLSRRCQNSQKNENTQTSEVNSKFFSKFHSNHNTP